MTSAAGLLADLSARGFAVAAAGDGLRVTPAGRLSEADREAIRAHKAELLALLLTPAAEDPDAWTCRAIEQHLGEPPGALELFPPPRRCAGCDFCKPKEDRREQGQ